MIQKNTSFAVVGQGLAGTLIAFELLRAGAEVVVYDEGHHEAASAVAAGLINPITGRRLVKSEQIDELLPIAADTYQALEQLLSVKIWSPQYVLWTLSSIKEENDWLLKADDERIQHYIDTSLDTSDLKPFFKKNIQFGVVKNAAQVDLQTLIASFRTFLKNKNILKEEKYFYQNIENQIVIYCEGEKARFNPFWENLPFVVAKGEALEVHFKEKKINHIVKNNISIVPLPNGNHWIGSNYEWNPKDNTPTPAIKEVFLQDLNNILTIDYEIVNHKAAIRPSTKNRKPIIGFHPTIPNIAIFNGMGTKGTLLAPFHAKNFIKDLLNGQKTIVEDVEK